MSEGFWGFVAYITTVFWWFGSEAGRVYTSGAAGGVMRWWMTRPRKWNDIIPSIIAGAVFAKFLSPIVLAIIEKWVGPIGVGGQDAATFATGLMGLSMVRIILAMVEKQASKIGDDK